MAFPRPRPPGSPDRRRWFWAVLGVCLMGAVLIGWNLRSSSPAPVQQAAPLFEEGRVPVVQAMPVPVESRPLPAGVPPVVATPQQDTPDPFQAYRQIRKPPTPVPSAQAEPAPVRPVPAQPPLPLPAPLPVLPPPPTVLAPAAPRPKPPTLQERLQASGWTLLAVGVGVEPAALLDRQGEQGLYRVGDVLEERIRIQRIETNRVILVRDDEQATMEVLP